MNVMRRIEIDVPTVDELVARAAALRPVLTERAAQTERDRRVSPDTIALLREAGLLRLGQPKRFGGYEHGPSAMLRVGFELARGCGSTSWCTSIANVNAWLACYWPLEAQAAIWGRAPDHLVTGTFVPTGSCAAVEGGYAISGRWPFASNCDNSDWLFVSALLPEGQGVGWFMVPRDALSIDQDSWHVAGMQGTGSKTLVADAPVFVPAARTLLFSDVVKRTMPGRAVPDNPMAEFAFTTLGAVTLVAPLLGMAQGALDWFVEAMKAKVKTSLKPGAPVGVAQGQDAQQRVGQASALIDAAMALLLADLAPFEAQVAAGEAPSDAARIRIRRDIAFAARAASDAVNLLFEGAGAASAALDSPIQRYWRDINAAARHASLDVPAIYAMVGQERFGLEPKGPF
ncbi:acyl-CoA dehydrogenase family protein [Sphingomonas profundi]|uniref:acyl-CoA dehydrogenase family protein n=1 Tax=Alterirhizorhabdus profundi TaxID=2681549 RepID=UPI0012E95603|nr:acyl-CoA dehydrogenase family protein [Sphingomonas profundi]